MSKHVLFRRRGDDAGERNEQAYRGYLIKRNPLNGSISISKDGAHIGYANTIDDAKRSIDELVG